MFGFAYLAVFGTTDSLHVAFYVFKYKEIATEKMENLVLYSSSFASWVETPI